MMNQLNRHQTMLPKDCLIEALGVLHHNRSSRVGLYRGSEPDRFFCLCFLFGGFSLLFSAEVVWYGVSDL